MADNDKRAAPPSARGGEKKRDDKNTPTKKFGAGRRDVSSLDGSTVPSASSVISVSAALKTLADFMNYLRGAEGVERVEGAEEGAKPPASGAGAGGAPEEDAKPSASGTGAAKMSDNTVEGAPAWTALIGANSNITSTRVAKRDIDSASKRLRECMEMSDGAAGHPQFDKLFRIVDADMRRNYPHLPDNLMDMVRPWDNVATWDIPGLYLKDGKKAGEAKNLQDRVIVRQEGKEEECFVILLGSELIPLGLVSKATVDSIRSLDLEILRGMDASRGVRIEAKAARQVAEAIFIAGYEVLSTPVLEFLLLQPDEKIRKMAGVESMFEELENHKVEIVELLAATGEPLENTVDVPTWPTCQSILRKSTKFGCLLRVAHEDGSLTEHLCRSSVDAHRFGGFGDAYPRSPFFDVVDAIAPKIMRCTSAEQLEECFGSVPDEWYFMPENEAMYATMASGIFDAVFGVAQPPPLDEDSTVPPFDVPTSTLVRMQKQTWDVLQKCKPEWLRERFPAQITLRRLGAGIDVILARTDTNHRVLISGSHFLMLAPTQSYENRYNAIQGLMGEAVLMFQLGLLDASGLQTLSRRMLSLTMLLVGLKGDANNPEGNWRDALHYIAPEGLVAAASVPGQKALCDALRLDCKQYPAALRFLDKLGISDFNTVLRTRGSKIRIKEDDDGNFLMAFKVDGGSKLLFQYNQLDAARESKWLEPSLELLKEWDGRLVHEIVGGLLQTLFLHLDESNNATESKHNRLSALIDRVETEGGESAERLLAILNDLPDMYQKNSSPDRWMKRFGALKDNMNESNLSAGETFVVRVHGTGETKQKLDTIYNDWSSWIGLPDGGTPVVGLKREMLEEIDVSFDVDAARKAQQGKRTEDARVNFRARIRQRKAATEQKRKSGSK